MSSHYALNKTPRLCAQSAYTDEILGLCRHKMKHCKNKASSRFIRTSFFYFILIPSISFFSFVGILESSHHFDLKLVNNGGKYIPLSSFSRGGFEMKASSKKAFL